MNRSNRNRKNNKRQREYETLEGSFATFRRVGPYIKQLCRNRGVDLPFYDYFDSYADEYHTVAKDGLKQFPSLLGIFEVDENTYFDADRSRFAPGMDQILWNSTVERNGYGDNSDDSNVNGLTNAFRNADGKIRTLVLIRKAIPNSPPHREVRYMLKLIALLHELGHVQDIERELNFDHGKKTFNMLEAEVYAHLSSLERMAKSNYFQCLNTLVDALKKYTTGTDYRRDVSQLTLKRLPEYQLINVLKLLKQPPTTDELKMMGAKGRAAFATMKQ